jgi:hypothetical protein
MKQARFAPVTASLLARKGEARPWNDGSYRAWPAPPPDGAHLLPAGFGRSDGEADEKPAVVPPLTISAPSAEGTRKLTLRLSPSDYERLGLIATKRDITRQRLLHQILDEFLATAADEYGAKCGCIGGSCQRQG